MTGNALLTIIQSPKGKGIFEALYGAGGVEPAQRRYASLLNGMLQWRHPVRPASFAGTFPGAFPETAGDLRVFTAPGRTELGGNHTDHNRGKVLAASIQLDSAAIVASRPDSIVVYRSTGYPDVVVDLTALEPVPAEKGTTDALVRGIAAELHRRGVPVRGFTANADSTVLAGSGLSSSAAVEVLIGRIFDCLYGKGKRSALEIAQIGQKAENGYFGKPCGLMDQTACASGGAVAIDFAGAGRPLGALFAAVSGNEASPVIKGVDDDAAAIAAHAAVIHLFFLAESGQFLSGDEGGSEAGAEMFAGEEGRSECPHESGYIQTGHFAFGQEFMARSTASL
jgi:galactokinase